MQRWLILSGISVVACMTEPLNIRELGIDLFCVSEPYGMGFGRLTDVFQACRITGSHTFLPLCGKV